MFWTPAFAGVTTLETFYEIIIFHGYEFCGTEKHIDIVSSIGLIKKS